MREINCIGLHITRHARTCDQHLSVKGGSGAMSRLRALEIIDREVLIEYGTSRWSYTSIRKKGDFRHNWKSKIHNIFK